MAVVQKAIAIPEPVNQVDSLWRTTQALKEAVEVLQGIRGNRTAALSSDLQEAVAALQQEINNISVTGGSGSQTPWTSNIDAAGYNLSDASGIDITGSSTLSGNALSITGTLPVMQFYETDAATDEGRWKIYGGAGSLFFRAQDDADSTGNSFFALRRTGTAPDSIELFTQIDCDDEFVLDAALRGHRWYQETLTPTGTTAALDLSTGCRRFVIDLASATGDVTATISNALPLSARMTDIEVKVIQDVTTPRDVTFAASGSGTVTWPGGVAPTVSTGSLAEDVFKFRTSEPVASGPNWIASREFSGDGESISIPTHTGEVTGDTNLSLDVTAITNQTELTSITIAADDELIVSDTSAGTLARADAAALTDAGNF